MASLYQSLQLITHSHQGQSCVLSIKAVAQQRHTGTQLGEALPTDHLTPGQGRGLKVPGLCPGTEGSQARRSSMLPKTLPAQGLAAGMTTLGTETSLPLLCSGTLVCPELSRSRMSKQTNKWPISGVNQMTMTGVIYCPQCQALCQSLYT